MIDPLIIIAAVMLIVMILLVRSIRPAPTAISYPPSIPPPFMPRPQ